MKNLLSLTAAIALLAFTSALNGQSAGAAAPSAAKPVAPVAPPAAKAVAAPAPVVTPATKAVAAPAPKTVAAPAPVVTSATKVVATPAPKTVAAPASVVTPAPKAAAVPATVKADPAEEIDSLAEAPSAVKAEETVPANTGISDPAPDPAGMAEMIPSNKKPEAPKKPNYKKSRYIPFLILTANYETPTFLAETARKEFSVPVIVVPENLQNPERDTLLTFRPAEERDRMSLRADELSRFLAFLRPATVIVLGNQDVVPEIYRLAIPEGATVVNLSDTAWKVNAIKLDDQLNSRRIYSAYRKHLLERRAAMEEARAAAAKAEAAARDAKEKAEVGH